MMIGYAINISKNLHLLSWNYGVMICYATNKSKNLHVLKSYHADIIQLSDANAIYCKRMIRSKVHTLCKMDAP